MRKYFLACVLLLFFHQGFSQTDQIVVKFSDPTISGESIMNNYTDHVIAQAVNYGLSRTVSTGGGGGGTSGVPTFQDVSFVHYGNQNSPLFNFFVANGQTLQKVEFKILRQNGGGGYPVEIFKVTLEDVIFTSVNTSATADCSSCPFGTESITLSYKRIRWEDPVNNISRGWDRQANTPF